jgi:hypothetical protein
MGIAGASTSSSTKSSLVYRLKGRTEKIITGAIRRQLTDISAWVTESPVDENADTLSIATVSTSTDFGHSTRGSVWKSISVYAISFSVADIVRVTDSLSIAFCSIGVVVVYTDATRANVSWITLSM